MRQKRKCGAYARSTGNPCQGKALRNGRCRNHGGNSTGPKTQEGRRAVGEATRIRVPLALADHFGNGRRVGFLDQCQPCPDYRFIAGRHRCRWLADGRGKGFRHYRVRMSFQNVGMGRLGTAGHFHRIAVGVMDQPPAGSGRRVASADFCRGCGLPFGGLCDGDSCDTCDSSSLTPCLCRKSRRCRSRNLAGLLLPKSG